LSKVTNQKIIQVLLFWFYILLAVTHLALFMSADQQKGAI